MHLKNWSLIYPDRKRPILSPAYDLLSTVPYIPDDESALKFPSARAWASFTYDELVAIADKARVASPMIVNAAKETAERFDDLWPAAKSGAAVFGRGRSGDRAPPEDAFHLAAGRLAVPIDKKPQRLVAKKVRLPNRTVARSRPW